jgi:hypothetical protein
MLTLARALGGRPRLLLADELSLGLAPLVVDRLLQDVRRRRAQGVAPGNREHLPVRRWAARSCRGHRRIASAEPSLLSRNPIIFGNEVADEHAEIL